MRNGVFWKGLVVGIILLFVGTSIVPSLSGNVTVKNEIKSTSNRGLVAYWSFDNESNPGYDDSGNNNQKRWHDISSIPEITYSYFMEANILIGTVASSSVWINEGSQILKAGYYTCKYKIQFMDLPYPSARVEGEWLVYAQIGNVIYFDSDTDSGTFNYCGTDTPDDIEIEVKKYISPGQKYASIGLFYRFDKFQNYDDYIETLYGEKYARNQYFFARVNRLNLPLISKLLENHFNLFLFFQTLLKYTK